MTPSWSCLKLLQQATIEIHWDRYKTLLVFDILQ